MAPPTVVLRRFAARDAPDTVFARRGPDWQAPARHPRRVSSRALVFAYYVSSRAPGPRALRVIPNARPSRAPWLCVYHASSKAPRARAEHSPAQQAPIQGGPTRARPHASRANPPVASTHRAPTRRSPPRIARQPAGRLHASRANQRCRRRMPCVAIKGPGSFIPSRCVSSRAPLICAIRRAQ